jgi:hypothetical protein
MYWPRHCHLAAESRKQGTLKTTFHLFLSNEALPTSPFTRWIKYLKINLGSVWKFGIFPVDRELQSRLIDCIAGPMLLLACSFDFFEILESEKMKITSFATLSDRAREDVLRACARNNSLQTMAWLLDQGKDDFTITNAPAFMESLARRKNNNDVLELLLSRREHQFTRPKVIKAIAKYFDHKAMALLLDRRNPQVIITEDIMTAAAQNELIDGKAVMELLLDRGGGDIINTHDVMMEAAQNRMEGKDIIELLLDRLGDDVIITDFVMMEAAGNLFGEDIIELLLDRRGGDIIITDHVIEIAEMNQMEGEAIKALLCRHRLVSEEVTV